MSAITKNGGRAAAPVRRGERSPAIDGIRGLAALALLTIHVGMFSGLLGTKALGTPRPPSNFVGAFFVSGLPSFIGVFFVLPAFFLYLPLAKAIIAGTPRPPQVRGLIRRLLRLLPAYYAMFFVTLLTLNREFIDGIWYVLRPILLLQVYLPTPFVPKMINGMEISWTVPSMVQWYLALPLIAWATHRFARRGATPAARARRLMLPVPILVAIGVGWLFFVKANGWDNRIVFWWPPGFAHTIGIGMALAILLALSQVSPEHTSRLFRAAAAKPYWFWFGCVVVYLVNCARPFSVIGMDAIYSVSGLLVTYLMVAAFGLLAVLPLISPGARAHAVTNFLGSRPIAFLGRISYGIYLWHFAVMHFYLQPGSLFEGPTKPLRELYATAGFWELELVTVTGTVIIATLSFYLLEQPIAVWGERFLPNRKPTAGPARAKPPRPPANAEPGAETMSAEQVETAVAAAAADRDAIRANLLDLEGSFGKELLAGANLTGQTRKRWDTATADLTTLWEIFTAYSAVVDQASTSDPATVSRLLTGPSIQIVCPPVPLAQRHITDSGRTHLTLNAAVVQMNQLFTKTAALVTTVETIWNDVSNQLDRIADDLAIVKRHAAESAALATAEAELQRHRHLLATDPLSLWHKGKLDTTDLDALRRHVAAARARTLHSIQDSDETAA